MRLAISQNRLGWPRNAKTKIAITITQSRKAVPQRGWMRLKPFTRLRGQLLARLQRVDRLVLGAVVLEDTAAGRGAARSGPEVRDEEGRANNSPSTITKMPVVSIGSQLVIRAGVTLNSVRANPIATAKAKMSSPRESSVETSPSSPSSCAA